jgi:hypothetical protein
MPSTWSEAHGAITFLPSMIVVSLGVPPGLAPLHRSKFLVCEANLIAGTTLFGTQQGGHGALEERGGPAAQEREEAARAASGAELAVDQAEVLEDFARGDDPVHDPSRVT